MRMKTSAVIILTCLAGLAATGLGPKKSKSKTKPLLKAVRRAQRLATNLTSPGKETKQIIDDLGVFDGKLHFLLRIKDISQDDDNMTVRGHFVAKRMGRGIYRTADERLQLSDLKASIKDLEEEIKDHLQTMREREGESRKYLARDIRRYNRNKKAAPAKAKRLKRELHTLAKSIKTNEESRQKEAEYIQITLVIPHSKIATFDMEKLLLKKKVKTAARVLSYELGTDPSEIGGHIRISSMRMQLLSFVSIKKK